MRLNVEKINLGAIVNMSRIVTTFNEKHEYYIIHFYYCYYFIAVSRITYYYNL